MVMNDGDTVLITGASSGIGLALAHEFGAHGHTLVINSPAWPELKKVAANLATTHGVEVIPIARDLTEEEAPFQILDELDELGVEVHTLVNNAGCGQRGFFSQTPLEKDVNILRLNIEAVVRMTKLFLPRMLDRNAGAILNTASVAGFEPGPVLSVYPASKAFVLAFTEALAVELENTNVKVTALCPGATDTDFFTKAEMTGTRIYQSGNLMPPSEVAAAAYQALRQGDRICVPGALNKTLVAKRRFLTIPATARINEKFYEDAPSRGSQRGF